MNINLLKLIIAVLLIICPLNMPNGYYQFVRFIAMIGFAYLAYSTNGKNNKNKVFFYIALAILFQPIVKIALGRTLWNIVDVLVGVCLLVSIITPHKKRNSK